jgi:hypothetical protein
VPDYFEPMLELTRNLGRLVTVSAADHEREQRIAATAVEVPNIVFSHLQHGLAQNRNKWAETGDTIFFEPLSGEMRMNGILIKSSGVR